MSRNIFSILGTVLLLVKMESYDVIANQPVVIDNGSGMIKAGFAGDQVSKSYFSQQPVTKTFY